MLIVVVVLLCNTLVGLQLQLLVVMKVLYEDFVHRFCVKVWYGYGAFEPFLIFVTETDPARRRVLNSRGNNPVSMERLFHPLVRSRKNLGCGELAFNAFCKKVGRANRSCEIMQSPASGGTSATALLRWRVCGIRRSSGI